jgi:hypothetical protein
VRTGGADCWQTLQLAAAHQSRSPAYYEYLQITPVQIDKRLLLVSAEVDLNHVATEKMHTISSRGFSEGHAAARHFNFAAEADSPSTVDRPPFTEPAGLRATAVR